jgi:hypothetical protein
VASDADIVHDLPLLEEYFLASGIRRRFEVPCGRGRIVWDRCGGLTRKSRAWRIMEEEPRRARFHPFRRPLAPHVEHPMIVDSPAELVRPLVKLINLFCEEAKRLTARIEEASERFDDEVLPRLRRLEERQWAGAWKK